MPFIPHTANEIEEMLSSIGAADINALFDEIPADLRCGDLTEIPEGLTEMEVSRLMHEHATRDGQLTCFAGGGAYEHHIPAAVWEVTTRGEFYSAYTPYQAEASQGTLQLIYEYQTMMAGLTGMDVSNASLYDGASALAEAALMAVRGNRKSKSRKLLTIGALNPIYRKVADAIVSNQNISFEAVAYDENTGSTPVASLEKYSGEDITAVVIQQPNYFGVLEAVNEITDWAHANGALVIAITNPTTLAVLEAPGNWGEKGADIACGEGQPLGVPLASGGPYFGYMCCKMPLVRQMPGRIVGRTVDLDGKQGFALTLQAREQHIRRSKATSNICTNQGLLVTAATQYMAMLGAEGLANVATRCHQQTDKLIEALTEIDGVERVFNGHYFNECLLKLSKPVGVVLEQLADKGILGGIAVEQESPELEGCLLVCATETRTDVDIAAYAAALNVVLNGEEA